MEGRIIFISCIHVSNIKMSAQLSSTDSYFQLDDSMLGGLVNSMSLNAASRHKARCTGDVRQVLQSCTINNALHKFMKMCELLNVDCLHSQALHIVFMVMNRYTSSVQASVEYLLNAGENSHLRVEWEQATEMQKKPVISNMADWCCLVDMLEVDATLVQKNALLLHMRKSLLDVHVCNEDDTNSWSLAMRALLAVSVCCTPASKMLERVIIQSTPEVATQRNDVETQCLRCIGKLHDQNWSTAQINDQLVQVLQACSVKECMVLNLRSLLNKQREQEVQGVVKRRSNRLRLRDVLQEQDSFKDLRQTSFEDWCKTQRFASSTSRKLQLVLYFVRVQVCEVREEVLTQHFDIDIIKKMQSSCIASCDARAILSVMHMLRVYKHNIKHLLDFRTECLRHLSNTVRANLSLCGVVQLYVASYQHDSIREQCWKAVCSVWNHTMQCACEQFRQKYTYDLEGVLRNVFFCVGHDLVEGNVFEQ